MILTESVPEENTADLKSEQQAKKDAVKTKNKQIEKEKVEAAKELKPKRTQRKKRN